MSQIDNMIATQRRVEKTLRFLSAIAEQAIEGVVLAELNGTVRFANQAWAVMHGYSSRNELAGKPLSLFHTPQQMKNELACFIDQVKQNGQFQGSIAHARSDGTTFPTQTKMSLVKDQSGLGVGLVVFATDLSKNRQAEQHLKQQLNKLTATNEQLVKKITEHEQNKQHLEQKIGELTANNEQLQKKIAAQQQAEADLKRQIAELDADRKRLQNKITEYEQIETELQEYSNQLEEQTSELIADNDQLHQEIIELEKTNAQFWQCHNRPG